MKIRVDKAVAKAIKTIDEEAEYLDEEEQRLFFDRLMLYCEERGGL